MASRRKGLGALPSGLRNPVYRYRRSFSYHVPLLVRPPSAL